jgi:integrase
MPKLPNNMVKRGRSFYFRKMVGGRVQRISLGSDYSEACRRLRSLKIEGVPPRSGTVEQAARAWLASYVRTARQERDWPLAEQRVRDYLLPSLGNVLLQRLTKEHVRSYRIALERTGRSPQTIRHILSDLRCLLSWCADSGLLEYSPFPRRVLPRIQERPPDRLTESELARVCSLPDPHGFVCRFLAATGLRWGEAIRAQARDFQDGLLVVHRTKTGKVRRIPVPDEFRQRVGRLVPFKSHGAFSRQVARLSGVSGFHVHQLRHTYACRWLERGGSLAALQELLGHSTIVTTQRYGRLSEAHVRAEATKVGQLVPQVVTGENAAAS